MNASWFYFFCNAYVHNLSFSANSAVSTMSDEVWGWCGYFTELATFIRSTQFRFQSANKQYTEYCINRLATCYRNVDAVKQSVEAYNLQNNNVLQGIEQDLSALCESISQMFVQWQQHLNTIDEGQGAAQYRVPALTTSSRGRPPFIIAKEQLVYLRSLSFSWSAISSLLGVSRMTIYRRRRAYGMLDELSCSMSRSELHQFVKDLRLELPDVGESLVVGRLRSLGNCIPRERVRVAIRETDPLNTALRWHRTTLHQPYSVPGPNSLWHIGKYSWLELS